MNAGEMPNARSVLRYVAETNLFAIPEVLIPFSTADAVVPKDDNGATGETGDQEEEVDVKSELGGWRLALEAPFDQIELYDLYVRGMSQFDTHQGVKGLEFPRVMVVVSDDEARGFIFDFDKLFETKAKSKTDLENEAAGKETTIDRTRRLFYVTCSRAEQSLAVVYYAAEPALARDAMVRQSWFEPGKIEMIT